jgi:hypothetical protein
MPDNQQSTQDSAGVDRTATGTIADQKQTTIPEAKTPQTTTTPEPAPTDDKSLINKGEEKSLANQKVETPAAPATGAPETYAAFTVPDGFTLDDAVSKEAGEMFKAMGLTQEQGQKLVDFYVGKTSEAVTQPYQVWRDTQARWVSEVKADPFLGPRLNQVTTTISKAIDQVAGNNAKLAEGFRQAMDFTGAGNHPAFIRMFYELASMITEGGHVAGGGPSPAGQSQKGDMPTAAKAMYPNLP